MKTKQTERRLFLINKLLGEGGGSEKFEPEKMSVQEQKNFLRSLMNIRMPAPISEDFITVQDDYLKQAISEKGITDIDSLAPVEKNIYIRQGDITTLKCSAIVNAANSQMLGCFVPCHTCIDNCIHTFAGVQLRIKCNELMREQGFEEPTGQAKITPAYNLPCEYVIHTVGPIVNGTLTQKDKILLASCYTECLKTAEKYKLESIAFCCISTGVFGFPQKEAAQIAVKTVKEYLSQTTSGIKVIFNVFKDEDREIYESILG